MLLQCCKDNHIQLSYPVSHEVILTFISWLHSRNLCTSTINTYLASLRQLHLALGLPIPDLRSDLVKQVLSGKKIMDATYPHSKPVRIPVTPTILRILKIKISQDQSLSLQDMRLYWAICSMAFHGSFRIGELLAKSPTSFDPRFTLLGRDIKTKATFINGSSITFIEVSLRSTKTTPTATTVIDIFPTNSDICPVRAFSKWVGLCQRSPSLPAFQLGSGKLLTPASLNYNLKRWLQDSLDFSKTTVSGHSFCAVLISVLGTLGFSDADLQSVSRWLSRAFLLYSKLPRTKRLAMAKAMGDLNL